MEERQERSLRPQNPVEPLNRELKERRRKKLERIPNERSIKMSFRKLERLPQKLAGPAGVGLILQEVAILAECIVHGPQDIVGIKAMAEAGDEADIGLARAREIEYAQIDLTGDRREKLVQSITGTSLQMRCCRCSHCAYRGGFLKWGSPALPNF